MRLRDLVSGRKRLYLFGGLGLLAASIYFLWQTGVGSMRLLETTLIAMTPLTLAATGECINEKAGVINIGIEGIFLIAALSGVYWAEIFQSGVLGLVFGSLTGALIGFFLGVMSVYGKADQIIAGMGINLLAIGLVPFLLMAIWAFPGIHIFPRELMVPRVRLDTPQGLFSMSPVTLLAIGAAILAYVLLHRTLLGLRIRAVGERPEAVDVAGVSVARVRILTSTLGGALAGLGGAFMPLGWFGGLTKEMSAGRGYIALAAVVFAGLNPLLALAGAFLFGFSEALAFTIVVTPGIKDLVPFYFVQMTPYLVTIVALVLVLGGRRFPRAIGRPYRRE